MSVNGSDRSGGAAEVLGLLVRFVVGDVDARAGVAVWGGAVIVGS